MSDQIEMDKLVEVYLTIRNERDNIARQYELQDAGLKEQMAKIESLMLDKCNDMGADSIRTGTGTIIKNLKETYVCGDWDNFKRFIIDNQALELLQQRISTTNLREYLSTREDEGMPPGISTMREYKITVRKPSKR
jgi:hypothetical protein|tara:strand:- start:2219 stop:2626 length:408 start_codon:yes stop_codon:yes gene_type:complete